MDLTSKNLSAVIFNLHQNSITHVRLDSKWFSIDELAAENLISPDNLREEFSFLLFQRLREKVEEGFLNDVNKKFEEKQTLNRLLDLISEYSQHDREELCSFLKALFKDHENVDALHVLSIMARKGGVPFDVFVKKGMRKL